jgi:phosphatidylethanolamine/phosphatidyl-N-methylethanolamine N-methyltransferase
MDHQSVTAAYRRYAPIYDVVFGAIFEPGRRRVVDVLDCQPGEEVLEVGVGTGLSLRHYPAHTRVTGIDLSPHMLKRAYDQVERHGLSHVGLFAMDVQDLAFPDSSFDKIAALYVASVVPDPERMLRELERVCRPGGEVLVVNHFTREKGVLARIEKSLDPLARALGFRPLFPLADFLAKARLELIESVPVNAFGYWTMLRFRKPS